MFNSIKQGKGVFVALALSTALFSCKKEKEVNVVEANNSKHFIDQSEAKSIASSLQFPNKETGDSDEFRKVKEVVGVPDQNGVPSYYIINFEKPSFLILSADDRVEPVRAFSTKNHFALNEKEYPSELVYWLESTSEMIAKSRLSKNEQSEEVKQEWKTCSIQNTIADKTDKSGDCGSSDRSGQEGPLCLTSYTIYTPLLETTWGQSGAYNDRTPLMNCSGDGRALTGCVATAMAQVMKYHEFPNNYYWNGMPDHSGSIYTAWLMRHIGDAVNMNYGCSSSSANTQSEAASSFKSDFGYSSASYANYSLGTVKSQIRARRPVILRGGKEKKNCFWIFCVSEYTNGHAWVCDGYRTNTYCSGNSYNYLHMNWGWNGSFNGYFTESNWNPGSSTFNYKRGMVYNIRP